MLRSYMGGTHASARAGAVLAIIGIIDVPIIYESVNWWRTLHPPAEVGVPGALPPSVVLTLMVSLTVFTVFYCFLLIQLYQLQRMQAVAQRLRATIEEGKEAIIMQGFAYLVAAYAIAWAGLFAYLAAVMLRIRGLRTELAAVEELVREQHEKQQE